MIQKTYLSIYSNSVIYKFMRSIGFNLHVLWKFFNVSLTLAASSQHGPRYLKNAGKFYDNLSVVQAIILIYLIKSSHCCSRKLEQSVPIVMWLWAFTLHAVCGLPTVIESFHTITS